MSAWGIYLLTRCDDVREIMGDVLVISFLGFAVASIIWGCLRSNIDSRELEAATADQYLRMVTWWRKMFGILIILCCVIKPLIPSTRDAAAIIVIPVLANSKDVQGLGSDVIDLARDWMKQLKPTVTPKEVK